jgi:hypothetical protein
MYNAYTPTGAEHPLLHWHHTVKRFARMQMCHAVSAASDQPKPPPIGQLLPGGETEPNPDPAPSSLQHVVQDWHECYVVLCADAFRWSIRDDEEGVVRLGELDAVIPVRLATGGFGFEVIRTDQLLDAAEIAEMRNRLAAAAGPRPAVLAARHSFAFYVGADQAERDSWVRQLEQLLAGDAASAVARRYGVAFHVGSAQRDSVAEWQPPAAASHGPSAVERAMQLPAHQLSPDNLLPGEEYVVALNCESRSAAFGVEFAPAEVHDEDGDGPPETICVVSSVEPGTPSAVARIQPGDQILSFANVDIHDQQTLDKVPHAPFHAPTSSRLTHRPSRRSRPCASRTIATSSST